MCAALFNDLAELSSSGDEENNHYVFDVVEIREEPKTLGDLDFHGPLELLGAIPMREKPPRFPSVLKSPEPKPGVPEGRKSRWRRYHRLKKRQALLWGTTPPLEDPRKLPPRLVSPHVDVGEYKWLKWRRYRAKKKLAASRRKGEEPTSKYGVRKNYADGRPRVGGRFVKIEVERALLNQDIPGPGVYIPKHKRKKNPTHRSRTGSGSPNTGIGLSSVAS
jgi:hypothetical protein